MQALGKPGSVKVCCMPEGQEPLETNACSSGVWEKVKQACKREIVPLPRLIIQRAQKQAWSLSHFPPEDFLSFLWD